ncbi:Dipeptidase [Venustampulla echinocandica]|uniref:Dipeptidase n=1 Tax=Venustampulla echinocandica TaxID=2656787 RepID=A0A370U0V7_9HELO|nr:Dipeptidase [Venustampulla echinocandica]RDL41419.1 Dipeptidase [Venustampulla echinocandica]
MSYCHYTEGDALLPTSNRAPEIPASQPPSLKEAYEPELQSFRKLKPPRNFIWTVIGLCVIVSTTVFITSQDFYSEFFKHLKPLPSPRTIEERVNKILTETPLIDGHNDLAIFIRYYYDNHIYDDKFTKPFEEGGMPLHVDLPRLKEGKNGGAFWSAFVPCPADGSDFSNENYADSVAFTLTQIDLLARLQAAYPAHFSPPLNSSTALSAFKSGQLISPLAIEGLHQIGNSIANLRLYYSLGVRYATLTHNCHNIYADAALTEISRGGVEVSKPKWGGVSPAGKELVHEMNRLGMIIDLAHVSQDTMRDVLGGSSDWDGSAAPPIYSHSSAYALCPHPRNVPDDILQLVKKKNSIVMVNFAPDFISCVANPSNPSGLPDFYPTNSTLQQVVRHIMHIGELIGYDHVGIGSDFDGIGSTPTGLDDVSKYPDLVAELLRGGVSNEDAAKVVGGNILRVWRDVDKVAASMQKNGEKPLEDKLPKPK